MKDPFIITYPNSESYYINPSYEISKHAIKMLGLKNFRKQLQYYNKYICTLSYQMSSEGLHPCGEYDSARIDGVVIFKMGEPFTKVEVDIYLQERQKEIERLKKIIDSCNSYGKKLACFFEKKAGQIDVSILKIISNDYLIFLLNGASVVPDHLRGNNAEIDLNPWSYPQIEAYNLYVYKHVKLLIKKPEKLHKVVLKEYQGFLFEKTIKKFLIQIENSIDRSLSINMEMNRIENKFRLNKMIDYVDHLYDVSFYGINEIWQSALFNAFINGMNYDYSRNKLSLDQVKQLIHIEQIFLYYKKLLELKNELVISKDNPEGKKPPIPKLASIFNGKGFDMCQKILRDLQVIDISGQCLLRVVPGRKKSGKGYLLFAVIIALKEHTGTELLNRNYNEAELLSIFNKYLGTDFKRIRKGREKSGYKAALHRAKTIIRTS